LDLAVLVVRLEENKVSSLHWVGTGSASALEVCVLPECLIGLFDYGSGILLPNEDDERRFGVPPHKVTKKLVDSITEPLLASPELAFPDEGISVFNANQDVCLSIAIEQLSGRR
jgi:hypothetical protein